jgi:excisionase family DNA binding protein
LRELGNSDVGQIDGPLSRTVLMGFGQQQRDGEARDLSPREAAEQTGLSRTLIYREIERGYLRAYKVGGRLRISADDLVDWKRLHAVVPSSSVAPYEPAVAGSSSRTTAGFLADLRTMRGESAA